MIILGVLILLALCCEAFFSGAETAFISVNFLKLMHLIERKNKRAMLVHNLIKKPDLFLVTTLIGTSLSVVVSSACTTALFHKVNTGYADLLTILILAPLAFVFCQLLPKAICRYKANRMALNMAPWVSLSEKVFFPLVHFFSFLANAVALIVNPSGLRKNPFLTKDEIKSLIKDISREGILEPQEKEAIDKIFDLTLTKAADIMVSVKDVITVDLVENSDTIKEKCRLSHLTRFPVFNKKTLEGVVNVFDIFYAVGQAKDWKFFIRPLMKIENTESLDKVFSKMQPSKEMMAAVFKGSEMVGILTMEDLMEDIVSKLTAIKKG